MDTDKKAGEEFRGKTSCGENLYLQNLQRGGCIEHARLRYELETIIDEFAEFSAAAGKKLLEINVGPGADHQRFGLARTVLPRRLLRRCAGSHGLFMLIQAVK